MPGETTLAEVKEIIGKLWKAVDQLKLSHGADTVKIGEKLDTWIDTNRMLLESNQELMRAVVLHSQETQRSIRSYESGSKLWSELKLQLDSLQQVTVQLKRSSHDGAQAQARAQAIEPPPNPLQLTQLLETIGAMQTTLNGLNSSQMKPPSPTATTHPLNTESSWRQRLIWAGIGLGVGVPLAIALSLFTPMGTASAKGELSGEAADLLKWATSAEGRRARNIFEWNRHKFNTCQDEIANLGVAIAVDGTPARSGFCTLWVEPPEKRKF
ncbi:DUF6753 family protein [Leptolyngbya sp. AN02str]|uniref:DUF6753 family protein n=1 Tax=Leptolyngbya sp. AN02str TaxID=3423363 RepID=UPI003D321ED5